jgi:hypothetical protein
MIARHWRRLGALSRRPGRDELPLVRYLLSRIEKTTFGQRKMRTLYLMCGFSFSGKSTLARKIIERLRCAYISLDDINAERGLWGGDGISVEEWERTHALARERLATWMATRKDALVDDVNNLRKLLYTTNIYCLRPIDRYYNS